jgi:transcriptional regulator with XRE-family HTH domain
MYNVSLKELGSRLKQIRSYLGLSQKDLAEKSQCNQVAISRLENGIGGTIIGLTSILSFYSQYIYINYVFAEKFYLISTDNQEASRSNLDSVISGVLCQALKKYDEDDRNAKEELKKTFDAAIGLLKG